jgi:hypothetical protein
VQSSAAHYVFLVSRVLALCTRIAVTVTVVAAENCTLNIKYKKNAKKLQKIPDSYNT